MRVGAVANVRRMRIALYRLPAFLLVPLVVLLLVRNDLLQAGWLDPIIYLAFAHDYADIAARYPGTYYGTRLSHILPNALAFAAFGERAGYYVVRWLELAVAMVAIHRIARHYADEIAAWFLAVFFCSHAWFLRSLLWDHYEATVVVYALIGIALSLPGERNDWRRHVAAGVAFVLAINGNTMGLVIAGAYFPPWLIERWHWSRSDKLRLIGAGIAGAVTAQAALIAVAIAITPTENWDLIGNIVQVVANLLATSGVHYFKSLGDLVVVRQVYQPFVMPFAILAAAVAVALGDRRDPERRRRALGALAFASMMTLAFAALHWLKVGVVSLFYYVIYTLPAVLMALAALAGSWGAGSWRIADRRAALIGGAVFLVAHGAFWFGAHDLIAGESKAIMPFALPMTVVAFGALAALLMSAHLGRAITIATLLVALFASNGFFLQPNFTLVYGGGERRTTEWDVREGSLHLLTFVAERVPRREPLRFWYSKRDDNMNTVQSAHMWGISRLGFPADSNAMFPDLDVAAREDLARTRHLMILGDAAEIAAALGRIRAAGFPAEVAGQGEFRGRQWPGFSIMHVTLR
jgi:hypothetical protein